MFPSFEFFGRTIGTYSVLSVAGLTVCIIFSVIYCKRYNFDFDSLLLLLLIAMAGLIIGGHLLFGITNINIIIKLLKGLNKHNILKIIKAIAYAFGGMVFYGGLIGAYFSIKIYSHFNKENTLGERLDIFGICTPLFHTFGRIGCFFGGCCYGIESKFGFVVHGNELIPELNGVRRFPVSLTEAFFNILIFLTVLKLSKYQRFKDKLIYYYGLLYSPIRFMLEFLRGDSIRGHLALLSTSQWISIVVLIFCICKLFIIKKKTDIGYK